MEEKENFIYQPPFPGHSRQSHHRPLFAMNWSKVVINRPKTIFYIDKTSTNCVTWLFKVKRFTSLHIYIYIIYIVCKIYLQHLQLFQSCLSILQSRKLRHPWQFPTGSLSWISCHADPPSCHSSWPQWGKWRPTAKTTKQHDRKPKHGNINKPSTALIASCPQQLLLRIKWLVREGLRHFCQTILSASPDAPRDCWCWSRHTSTHPQKLSKHAATIETVQVRSPKYRLNGFERSQHSVRVNSNSPK